ncbi:hypothetical protein [Flavobacterium sp.]|uniref:hypothetical protein n=1 Tax=Flavobacterium sp. TaxID=239 RepID=UPI00334036C4
MEFVPTDGRQVYCSSQHRIDSNNDKRKIIDAIESNFTSRAKNNEKILIKIIGSPFYIKNGFSHTFFLEHEYYDFGTYHTIKYDEATNREIHFCYNHGILLIDAEKKHFKIIIKEKNED